MAVHQGRRSRQLTIRLVNWERSVTVSGIIHMLAVDVERFAGLNVRSFNSIEVFLEILSNCLGQKCLLFIIINKRCLYSQENFLGTLENRENIKD